MKPELLRDNYNSIIKIVFNHFGLKYDAYAKTLHTHHPIYPSYASIAYVLSRYGIDSCLITTDINELYNIPTPFIINYDGMFLPISNVKDGIIDILIAPNQIKQEQITMLHSLWDKTVLVLNGSEINRSAPTTLQKFKFLWGKSMKILSIIIICAAIMHLLAKAANEYILYNWIIIISSTIGTIVCWLFQIQENNKHNTLINSLCYSHSNRKRNCASILDSNDAKFANLFSWADLGFLYFIFLYVVSLILSPSVSISIFILLSILASFYIPYSIIYQWKIAKQWCTLCLMTQAILLINVILSIIMLLNFNIHTVLNDYIIVIFIGISLIALFTSLKLLVKDILKWRKQSHISNIIKYDQTIKHYIFEKQPNISTGNVKSIVINPNATSTLTIVFNPTCVPCMREMRTILDWYKYKRELKLEFIILIDKSDSISYKIASFIIHQYYSNTDNFYEFISNYVNNYPSIINTIKRSLNCDNYEWVIDDHIKWCNMNNISSTPKKYLNGYEIPHIYSSDEIDYMIW